MDVEDHFSQQALAAPWGELGRSWTLGLVSLASKAVLTLLNDFSVEGLDTFLQHATTREPGVGLITVCNHTRCGAAAGSCGCRVPQPPTASAPTEAECRACHTCPLACHNLPAFASPLMCMQHGGRPRRLLRHAARLVLLHRASPPGQPVEPVRQGERGP